MRPVGNAAIPKGLALVNQSAIERELPLGNSRRALCYIIGAAFILTAALKPIFPANVGLFVVDGIPRAFGAQFPVPRGRRGWGGYGIIPISLAIGLGLLALTHRGGKALLSWWRARMTGSIRKSGAIESSR